MSRPLLLDLFCGAGGAAMGYYRAGFDVIGVDIEPQPNYPFRFVQADALAPPFDLADFDAIHASPPCQLYSVTRHTHSKTYPDLLDPTRELLQSSGRPWVIENVVGAPMPSAIILCGASFGLSAFDALSGKTLWLRRHRMFESPELMMPPPCNCHGKDIGGVYGGGPSNRNPNWNRGGYTPPLDVRRELMGIDWMPGKSLNEAIPPAYTEWIGTQLLDNLNTVSLLCESQTKESK